MPGSILVGTVNYTALGYEKLQTEGYVSGPARRDMMASVLDRWKGGHVSLVLWLCAEFLLMRHGSASVPTDSDHQMSPIVWV